MGSRDAKRPDYALAGRSVGLLAVTSSSVVLCGWQLAHGRATAAFVRDNTIPIGGSRLALAQCVIGAFVLVVLLACDRVARRGNAGVALVDRLSRLCCPLLLSAALPALFWRGIWATTQETGYLIVLGGSALALERLLQISFEVMPECVRRYVARLGELLTVGRGRHLALGACALVALWYAVSVSRSTILLHHTLQTTHSDLAEFDNCFYNALVGHPFRAPAMTLGQLGDWSTLKVHGELTLYLLLPLYAMAPGPELLLAIQACALGSAAIPLFLFARRRLDGLGALVVAVAYVLLPFVERPSFYDFHFIAIAVPLVLWTLYFVDRVVMPAEGSRPRRRDYVLLAVFFLVSCLTREEVAFGLGVAGVFILASRRAPRLGAAMAVLGILYAVLAKVAFSGFVGEWRLGWFYEALRAPERTGLGGTILTLITNPGFVLRSLLVEGKLLFVLHLIVPLAFLWLRRPWLLVAALPAFAFTLLVTNDFPPYTISFQYVHLWVPYVVVASVLGIEVLGRGRPDGARRRAAVLVTLLFASSAASWQFGALFGQRTVRGGYWVKRLVVSPEDHLRYAQVRELAALIPRRASVVASEYEGPHVSTREVLYSLKHTFGPEPDYALLGPNLGERERERARRALRSGRYGVEAERGEFVLLRRGADSAGTPRVCARLGGCR